MPADQSSVRYTRNSSEYTLLWASETQPTIYVPARKVQWGAQEVDLTVEPEDASDESFLAGLEPTSEALIAGYGHRVGVCNILENRYISEAGQKRFHLKLLVKRSDFIPSLEMSLGSTSADKLAELRARRLLLNENPAVESNDINAITRELFVGGQDTLIRVKRSSFPALFQQFGSNPDRFLEIAWINAVVQLKLSACVAEVVKLELTLKEASLDVSFVGKRKKQFQNKPPYEMRIKGSCSLLL